MPWALSFGRNALIVAVGIVIGAGASIVGIELSTGDRAVAAELATAPPAPAAQRILDVSRSALEQTGGASALVAMLDLAPGDRITAVDGAPAVTGVGELAVAWGRAAPGDYIDVELAHGHRALVLVHR